MVWLWAVFFIATLVVEIFTVEMVSIWFSVGSLVAFFLALCTKLNATVQILVFAGVSVVLMIALRAICMKLLQNSKEKTNVDLIVGTVHSLTKPIKDEEPGELKVNDVVWRAVTKNGDELAEKTKVKVLEVQGNKFIVEKFVDDKKKGDKKDE